MTALVPMPQRAGIVSEDSPDAARMLTSLDFRYATGREGLEGIESHWEALACSEEHRSLAFYQCPAWSRAYLERLAPNPDALIWVSGWHDHSLTLVLPLERSGGELHLLTHDHMTLADILAPNVDPSVWPELLAWLNSPLGPGYSRLRLPALHGGALLEKWLGENPAPLARERALEGSAWLDCSGSYDDMLKAASANHRSNLTRGLKRAVKLGIPRYETHSGPAALAAAMPHFLNIEASGWKGKQGGAVACKPELIAFYAELCEHFGARGRCEIDLLWLGEIPIATIYWFRTGGTLHLQKIAYLEEHGELGPGRLIMASALQRACADPTLHRVSFITRCPWADGWRTRIAPVHERVLYPTTSAGRFACTIDRTKSAIKQRLRSLKSIHKARAGAAL